MARKGRIEIGASVTVGAKEDGSLSAIEKRIEELSDKEIEISISDATKDLKELEKMEKKIGGKIGASIATKRKELADLIESYKQEQKLRADGLKQMNQEVKAAKELQKVEKKRIEAKEKKNGEPTKREQELIDITKVLQGIRGAVNVFDDLSIEKAEERLHQFNDLLDECQVKLDAMKRLRKGNERTMHDTAKSEIADLKRSLSAIQAVKNQTPSIKPKMEKKEKEVEQEKPKKTNAPTPTPVKDNSAEVIQQQASAAKQQARNLEQVNAELKKERENLAAIEQAQNRNDAAREALQRKRANYSGEALQSNKAVYDTDKLAAATEGLRTFNSELEKRNQFMERYKQLYRIVQGSFVGQYSISNGIYADMDQFMSGNPAMKELDSFAKNGIKGISTKHINELFTSVANSLRREASEIQRMINSGSVLGAKVIAELDQEEIRLGQEQQRLYDEREAQLTRINALHREEMDLIAQKGREEKKNTKVTEPSATSAQEQSGNKVKTLEQQTSATQTLTEANKELADSYLKVQEAAKKSLDVTDGSTFAIILKYYKELLNAPQDNEVVAAQKALIEKAFSGAKTPDQLNALQYVGDSDLAAMGNKLMLSASFEGEFLFDQISAYLQDIVGSTIDWSKALGTVEQQVQSIASQEQVPVSVPVQPTVASETVSAAIQEATPVEVPVTPVVEEITTEFAQETAKAKLTAIQRQAYNYRRSTKNPDALTERENTLSGRLSEISAIRTEFPALEDACGAAENAVSKTLDYLRQSIMSATASTATMQLAQGIQQVGETAQQTSQQLEHQAAANNALAESTERIAGASEQATPQAQNTPIAQSELEKFDTMEDISKWVSVFPEGKFREQFRGIYESIRQKVIDNVFDAEKAWEEIGGAVVDISALMSSEIESTSENVRKMSNAEYSTMLKGVDFERLFKEYGITRQEDKNIIYDELAKLGDMVISGSTDLNDQIENIIANIIDFAKVQSENYTGTMQELVRDLRSQGKILYDEDLKNRIGKDAWADIKATLGNMLTNNGRQSRSKPDQFFDGLPTYLQQAITSAYENESRAEMNYNEENILRGIMSIFRSANVEESKRFRKLDSDESEYLRQDAAGLIGQAINNVEQMIQSENEVRNAVERTNEARRDGVELQREIAGGAQPPVVPIQPSVVPGTVEDAIQESTDGEEVEVPVKPVVDEEEVKEVPEIVKRNIDDALEQLRSAKNSDKALINFEGAFTPDNLLKQFQDFAKSIDGLDLNVGKIDINKDNKSGTVELYSDELKVAVKQTWRLKEASEETGVTLEFLGRTYSQNVRALNANNFDVDGIHARAQASIEKLRSSLHGLEYDLTDLENAAKNISSRDDFNKFNNQLKAAQDNVQAMRNAVVSKSSLNQLANMQRDMKNANTELETMQINLQKIGEINGVEKARSIINDMRTAVENFNKATDAKAQEQAYNQYSDLRSQFGTQLKLLNATKSAGLTGFFDTDKNNQLVEFSRWESNIKNIRMLSDETSQRIRNMSDALNQVGDSDKLQKWIADFKKLKEDVSYESTSQNTKDRIAEIKNRLISQKKELETLYNNSGLGSATDTQGVNVREIYQQATDEINRCIEAIGRCSQEEVAAAATAGATAKQRIEEYASVKDFYEQMAQNENTKTGDDAIRNYYQTINSTIQQIAKLESQINSLKLKADGSAMYTSLIAGLEEQRDKLVSQVQDTATQISSAFNDNFVITNNVQLPYSTILDNLIDPTASNTIKNFFGDLYVQEALGEKAINNFSQTLQNAQTKAEQFANILNEKFEAVRKSAEALLELQKLGAVDANNEFYKNAQSKIGLFTQYNKSLSGKDPSTWSAGETINWQRLANDALSYSQSVEAAIQKEAKYFANKKQYANISNLQDYNNAANNMDAMSESTRKAKQVLEEYVNGFEGGKKIITGFTTSADGISKINFAMFEEGTNQFRTFSAEIGKFSNNIYTYETSMKNLTSGTDAAMKALSSLSAVMSRLNNIEGTEDIRNNLQKTMEGLSDAMNAPDASTAAGQTKLKNLAADAERTVKSISKLEQQWAKTQAAIDNGDLDPLGQINKDGDIYAQMLDKVQAAAKGAQVTVTGFDKTTNTLTYTLTNADGTVTTMTAHMHNLNGAVTTQQGETKKLASGWQEFTSGIGGALKGLQQYAGRMFSVWAIVGQLKKGFSAVKEIDASLTELKKVTDETESSYRNFLNTASKTAGNIGSTVSDFTTASANFARLGYTMEESAKMAETAIVYKNVAD